MKSIDHLLDRRKTATYHCVHFVVESAQYLLNADYNQCFLGMQSAIDDIKLTADSIRHMTATPTPSTGTIVVMTRLDARLHVGLFYDGKILHLTDNGVKLQALRSLSKIYPRVRYYEPTPTTT